MKPRCVPFSSTTIANAEGGMFDLLYQAETGYMVAELQAENNLIETNRDPRLCIVETHDVELFEIKSAADLDRIFAQYGIDQPE